MIRTLVCLSLVIAISACGIREEDLIDADGNPISDSGLIPPNPDWNATIPDEVSGLWDQAGVYRYISPGGYMARFMPPQGGDNCYEEVERQALFHDGGNDYTSIDANPEPGETAQTHTYSISLNDNGVDLNFGEILENGSIASGLSPVVGLLITDIPICRT